MQTLIVLGCSTYTGNVLIAYLSSEDQTIKLNTYRPISKFLTLMLIFKLKDALALRLPYILLRLKTLRLV